MKLSKIKPNPSNPRICKDARFEKLCTSLANFGEKMMPLRPIIIDENNVILGGNQRFKALKHLGYKDIPETWVKQALNLTEDEKKEFIIKDNVSFGENDWEVLDSEDWSDCPLEEWGLELPNDDGIITDGLGTGFSLPDGDKAPFQQMTFTLADEQAVFIKNAIDSIKHSDEYKYMETMGNENGNGNALYLLITKCEALKTAF